MVQSIIVIAVIVLLVCIRANRAKIIGKSGERKVSTLLHFLSSKYRVFNDVLIRSGQWTSQIDHIVVSQYGVFVIETKNYNGWIYGGVNQEQWTQNIWEHKNHLQNPIRQNNGHIIALKKILPEYAYNQYRSIIVFTSRASLRTRLPDYFNVIYTRQLLITTQKSGANTFTFFKYKGGEEREVDKDTLSQNPEQSIIKSCRYLVLVSDFVGQPLRLKYFYQWATGQKRRIEIGRRTYMYFKIRPFIGCLDFILRRMERKVSHIMHLLAERPYDNFLQFHSHLHKTTPDVIACR